MTFTGLPALKFLPLPLQELSAVTYYPVEHPHVDQMSCLSSQEHQSNQNLKGFSTHLDFPAPVITKYQKNSLKCRLHHRPQVLIHNKNPMGCFHIQLKFTHIYQRRYNLYLHSSLFPSSSTSSSSSAAALILPLNSLPDESPSHLHVALELAYKVGDDVLESKCLGVVGVFFFFETSR
jgi:hypothetical protein